jgi:hypothetical protein
VVVEKDLGVLIRQDLSWNDHVDFIISKAQKMLKLLYRICKDICDVKTKKLRYITWARSRLEYASVVWSPYTKRNISSLEKVQRRATRFIIGRDYSEYERLRKLNLLPLQNRREINDIIFFFFKCFKNIYAIDIFEYISFRSCCTSLRNVDHLTLAIPFSRTKAFKNSYFVRICRLWNDLPLAIRESNNLVTFRNRLLQFYKDKFSETFLL